MRELLLTLTLATCAFGAGARALGFSTAPRRPTPLHSAGITGRMTPRAASVSAPAHGSFKTADAAARALYRAWRAKSEAGAAAAADAAAVEKLFGVPWRTMKFKGCHKREEGDFECVYEDARNDLSLAMLAEVAGRGYRIKSLSFSSEAA
jgi:hypothetical protein